MIEVDREEHDVYIRISGQDIDVLDMSDSGDFVLAECELDDLRAELAQSLPQGVHIQVGSEDGFGTHLFHELTVSADDAGMVLDFDCLTPNKYWEGEYGLATYLAAICSQVQFHPCWKVAELEVDDTWKKLTLRRHIPFGEPLHANIIIAGNELRTLAQTAEVALSGLAWREAFSTDEGAFCRDLLLPLLRRMGFSFVRYSHGRKEYGKDFTFSEITPFSNYRHYGLQAKAGDISGEVNSAIDEILGQIEDAFSIPYYEVGSKDQRFISTLVIAISGRFTENAREKIVEKMPKGFADSVYFFDRERITELVERYWKSTKVDSRGLGA